MKTIKIKNIDKRENKFSRAEGSDSKRSFLLNRTNYLKVSRNDHGKAI